MTRLGKLKEYLLPVCLVIFFTVCVDGREMKTTKNLLKFCNLPYTYPVKNAMYFLGNLHCCNCPIGQEVKEHCRINEPLSTICRDKTIQPTELPPVSPNVLVTPHNVTQTTTANNSLGGESDHKIFVCDGVNPDNTWKDILLCFSFVLNVIFIILLCRMKEWSCKENGSKAGPIGPIEEDSDIEASGSNNTIAEDISGNSTLLSQPASQLRTDNRSDSNENVAWQHSVGYNVAENLDDEAQSLTGTGGISINGNEHGVRHRNSGSSDA